MNENSKEIMENNEGINESDEGELSEMVNGTDVEEGGVSNDTSEEEAESLAGTVSDGDSETLSLILEELQLHTEKIENLQTCQEEKDLSLFEKQLSKYTATEGLLLIVVLILTAEMIFKKIGGILRCEKE